MQLASICIRQQLTDAQMAGSRDALAIFGRGKGRLAAILSEAVPIWMETTTLHCCDDDSSLGAVGAHCCCSRSDAFKARHMQSIHTQTERSLSCR